MFKKQTIWYRGSSLIGHVTKNVHSKVNTGKSVSRTTAILDMRSSQGRLGTGICPNIAFRVVVIIVMTIWRLAGWKCRSGDKGLCKGFPVSCQGGGGFQKKDFGGPPPLKIRQNYFKWSFSQVTRSCRQKNLLRHKFHWILSATCHPCTSEALVSSFCFFSLLPLRLSLCHCLPGNLLLWSSQSYLILWHCGISRELIGWWEEEGKIESNLMMMVMKKGSNLSTSWEEEGEIEN